MVSLILFTQNSYASGEDEYLLDGEQIGNQLLIFNMNGQKYYIYDIRDRKMDGFIVIGPSQRIPDDDEIKKSFFIYYSLKYIDENQFKIRDSYQNVYYDLSIKSHSISQQILDAFKNIPKVCMKVPELEVISICVEPTENIEIMKVNIIGFKTNVVDWDTAFDNYKKVGGEIFAIIGVDKTNYEDIESLYKNYKSSEIFLEKAGLINNYEILKTDNIVNFVSANTIREYSLLSNRLSTLKSTEGNKKQEADKILEDIKTNLTEIARKNGQISDIDSKRKSIIISLNKINTGDYYYTSDIKSLNNAISEASNLKLEIDNRTVSTINNYNSSNSLMKLIHGIAGYFKSLRIK